MVQKCLPVSRGGEASPSTGNSALLLLGSRAGPMAGFVGIPWLGLAVSVFGGCGSFSSGAAGGRAYEACGPLDWIRAGLLAGPGAAAPQRAIELACPALSRSVAGWSAGRGSGEGSWTADYSLACAEFRANDYQNLCAFAARVDRSKCRYPFEHCHLVKFISFFLRCEDRH